MSPPQTGAELTFAIVSPPQNIAWMREAELEHGRLCMLAWTVSSTLPDRTHALSA